MVNKLISVIIFSFVVCTLSAQRKINLDRNCLRQNSAIFSQVLIDLKGEYFVTNLLDNNINFSIICVVDSMGTIMDLKKIRSKKALPEELGQEILFFLRVNSISFNICYEKPLGVTEAEAYNFIRKDLSNRKITTHLVGIHFPGDIMSLYEYERDKEEEQGLCLSKYEYLLSMMNKYIPQ